MSKKDLNKQTLKELKATIKEMKSLHQKRQEIMQELNKPKK